MKRILVILLALLMLPTVAAAEETPKEIHTPEDLLAISADPSGSYILMEDLDMTGVFWESPEFSGTFDGNGHALLNLTVTQTGPARVQTYDGNLKVYDTACAGLFSVLRDARVKNLRLLGLEAVTEGDVPVFLGGIAGYMENSVIENCEISGRLELRAHDRMFGIGGVAGYGSGTVTGCRLDVTLICVDTDAQTLDEQFLGGVYGGGYIHVTDCEIGLDAYISEHGYVHSGGITGMFLRYPGSTGDTARFQNNRVEGAITFFEDNRDRRAYCEAFIGEILVYTAFYFDGNTHAFRRNEVTDYSRELRPEMCENPVYQQTVTAGSCDSFGFTTFCCQSCGYTYCGSYTLAEHTLTQWTMVREATEDAEGLKESACDLCGQVFQAPVDKLAPAPTETQPPETAPAESQAPTEEAVPVPEEPDAGGKHVWPFFLLAAGIGAAAVILLLAVKRPKKAGRFQR